MGLRHILLSGSKQVFFSYAFCLDKENMGENFQDHSWIQDFEADFP